MSTTEVTTECIPEYQCGTEFIRASAFQFTPNCLDRIAAATSPISLPTRIARSAQPATIVNQADTSIQITSVYHTCDLESTHFDKDSVPATCFDDRCVQENIVLYGHYEFTLNGDPQTIDSTEQFTHVPTCATQCSINSGAPGPCPATPDDVGQCASYEYSCVDTSDDFVVDSSSLCAAAAAQPPSDVQAAIAGIQIGNCRNKCTLDPTPTTASILYNCVDGPVLSACPDPAVLTLNPTKVCVTVVGQTTTYVGVSSTPPCGAIPADGVDDTVTLTRCEFQCRVATTTNAFTTASCSANSCDRTCLSSVPWNHSSKPALDAQCEFSLQVGDDGVTSKVLPSAACTAPAPADCPASSCTQVCGVLGSQPDQPCTDDLFSVATCGANPARAVGLQLATGTFTSCTPTTCDASQLPAAERPVDKVSDIAAACSNSIIVKCSVDNTSFDEDDCTTELACPYDTANADCFPTAPVYYQCFASTPSASLSLVSTSSATGFPAEYVPFLLELCGSDFISNNLMSSSTTNYQVDTPCAACPDFFACLVDGEVVDCPEIDICASPAVLSSLDKACSDDNLLIVYPLRCLNSAGQYVPAYDASGEASTDCLSDPAVNGPQNTWSCPGTVECTFEYFCSNYGAAASTGIDCGEYAFPADCYAKSGSESTFSEEIDQCPALTFGADASATFINRRDVRCTPFAQGAIFTPVTLSPSWVPICVGTVPALTQSCVVGACSDAGVICTVSSLSSLTVIGNPTAGVITDQSTANIGWVWAGQSVQATISWKYPSQSNWTLIATVDVSDGTYTWVTPVFDHGGPTTLIIRIAVAGDIVPALTATSQLAFRQTCATLTCSGPNLAQIPCLMASNVPTCQCAEAADGSVATYQPLLGCRKKPSCTALDVDPIDLNKLMCANSGYLGWSVDLTTATQCNAKCTCPGNQDPDTNCAICNPNQVCPLAVGAAFPANDLRCGCKSCWRGLSGTLCDECQVYGLINITNPTATILAYFGNQTLTSAQSTAYGDWSSSAIASISVILGYDASSIGLNLELSRVVITDITTLMIVVNINGACGTVEEEEEESPFVFTHDGDHVVAASGSAAWVTSTNDQFAAAPFVSSASNADSVTTRSDKVYDPKCTGDDCGADFLPAEAVDCNVRTDLEQCQPVSPNPPKKSNPNNTIIIAVVCAVGAALIVAGLIVIIVCCCCKDESPSNSSDGQDDHKYHTSRNNKFNKSTRKSIHEGTDHLELV